VGGGENLGREQLFMERNLTRLIKGRRRWLVFYKGGVDCKSIITDFETKRGEREIRKGYCKVWGNDHF